MENKTQIKTFLPLFNGFYNTLFENLIDDATDAVIEYYNEDNNTNLDYSNFDFDFQKLQNEISKDCVDIVSSKINELLNCKITFEDLISPKYYNYSNDSINITIEGLDKKEFMKVVFDHKETLEFFIHRDYTSCSGFTSSYSNDFNDWIDDIYTNFENCSHQIGAIINYLLPEILEYTTETLYFELSENYYQIDYSICD